MKTGTRILLIYGVSVAGAAAVAYWRGRTVRQLVSDAVLHGAIVGTGVNVIAAVVVAEDGTLLAIARHNAVSGVGKLGKQGVQLLASIDTDRLYREMNDSGVRVAPVPENADIINQDEV